MQPLGHSWLAASATAPMVAVVAIWTIYVFHTYRRRWRTVDLFLVAAATQELVTAAFAFAFALLNLLGPRFGEAACGFVLWGLTSTRTFQVATLTSLLVDRALTVRWPYRYRLSVRRNQIRYHIAVLAVTSLFVGVAAVFARLQQVVVTSPGLEPQPLVSGCSLHPLGWDLKFSIFVLCLYGVLSLTAMACWVDVESRRCRQQQQLQPSSPALGPYAVPLPETRMSSSGGTGHLPQIPSATGSVSSTSSGSTRFLYGRQKFAESRAAVLDFRWTPVAAVSVCCFAINHFPFLTLTLLGTVAPSVWSSWYENALLWLRLLEGFLLPLILCLTDQPHRAGLKRIWAKAESKATLHGSSGKPKGGEGRFSPLFRSGSEALPPYSGLHVPLPPYSQAGLPPKNGGPFGSMTPVGIITNYRRSRDHASCKSRSWIRSWNTFAMPNVYGAMDAAAMATRGRYFPHAAFSSHIGSHDDETIKKNKRDFEDELSEGTLDYKEEDHIYASLSEVEDNFSFQSTLADESALMAEDIYGGSFTTVANDDFEFHDTRPCGGEVRMRPGTTLPPRPSPPPLPRENKTSTTQEDYEVGQDLSLVREEDTDDRVSTTSGDSSFIQEVVIRVDRSPSNTSSPSKTDSGIVRESNVDDDDEPDQSLRVYRVADDALRKQLCGTRKSTSFSMNDLDLIEGTPREGCKSERDDEREEEEDEEEIDPLYVYPIKSGSVASLQSGSLSPPPTSSDVGSFRARSEGRLDWGSRGIGALWDHSRRRPSTILSDVMQYSRSKRHITKSKKYRVSSQSSASSSSKSSRSPVSLSGVQRKGSDVRYHGSFQKHGHSIAGYPYELPHPLNANFRLQHPSMFAEPFGYRPSLNGVRHLTHRHPHPHNRCTISGFV